MLHRKRFHPGDPITDFTADDYRAIARELRRLANLKVCVPLTLAEFPRGGRVIGLDRPETIVATLSGSSSPYSWTEAIHQPGNTWVAGYRSGTANAYEVSGASGLGGKRAFLRATAGDDWRFQFVRVGSTPCTGGTGQICATVTSDGCGTVLTGATITVKDHTGAIVGTCTTDATGKGCIAIPSSGTYTVTSDVPGTATLTVTINAVCSLTTNNVSFNYPTNSLGTLCFNATTCKSPCTGGGSGVISGVSGARLSYTGPGSGSITSGQCIRLAVGSYSGTITYPSGATLSTSFSITACQTTTVSAQSISSFVFGVSYRGTCVPPCTSCSCNYTLTWAATGAPIASGTLTVPCVGTGGCGVAGYGCVEIPIPDQFTNPNINWTAIFTGHTFSGTMQLYCGNVGQISYDTFGGNPNLC